MGDVSHRQNLFPLFVPLGFANQSVLPVSLLNSLLENFFEAHALNKPPTSIHN